MISRYVVAIAMGVTLLAMPTIEAPAQNVTTEATHSLPFLSPIFGDDMVLQRGKLDAIWGWSDPGDVVSVQIGDSRASATTGPDHRWQVKIQPPKVGGPYTVHVAGRQTRELHNVLVGDVWLCGGQSNMGLPLRATRDAESEIKAAAYPEIRFFTVGAHPAYRPSETIEGSWKIVSPGTAADISAVAYYFARKVQEQVHVPIGLVVDSLGGTPAEAWTSAAALRPLGDFDASLAELQRLTAAHAPEYGNYVMHWYDEYDEGQRAGWAGAAFNDSEWKQVAVPSGFAEAGPAETPAVMWFRKEITLPDPVPPGRAMLFLGQIERMDTAYVNGTQVGGSAWVENPRAYPVPDGVLKPGRNVIAVRVLKTKPDGGFLSKPADLHLTLGDHAVTPLAGAWKAKLSVDARPPHLLPISYENWPVIPTVLYRGMLKPLAPLALTGAIWYQGEQNSERGYRYRKLLPAMIADWRTLFDQGDFPFYIVSLPAFGHRSAVPVEAAWAETRESQAIVAATVPDSCLAVTIDTGDPDNLHPKDKRPVGERLADCALAGHYGKSIVSAGPTLASVDRLPGSIRLHFSHTDGGLVVRGNKLEEFSVAGADHRWSWADARIEGDTIVVSSPSVPAPSEVRYAWQSNPAATLFNGAGLPAAPFRTDAWPAITDKP